MVETGTDKLTRAEIERILLQPNGPYVLLELVRMGRVDTDEATKALDRFDREPLLKRIALSLLDALLGGR